MDTATKTGLTFRVRMIRVQIESRYLSEPYHHTDCGTIWITSVLHTGTVTDTDTLEDVRVEGTDHRGNKIDVTLRQVSIHAGEIELLAMAFRARDTQA